MPELPRFELLELSAQERQAFLGRVAAGCTVSEADYRLIESMTVGLPDLLALIARQDMTIGRLRQSLFGPRTEKTTATVAALSPSSQAPMPGRAAEPKPKPPGHGRYGADAYSAAQRIRVAHPHLRGGDRCPDCQKAKLYPVHPSGVALRIVGQAPLAAKLFELEKLRCAACGKLYTAPTPEEAGSAKYDESVGVLVALLRFGSGVPFYRLAKLQHTLGIPLPSSVQWALVYALYQIATPVLECLIHQAAQRSILHNDDTSMRVASLRLLPAPPSADDEDLKGLRTGVFTTAILSDGDQPPVALFFTGRQHAGENLHDLLGHRAAQLPPPIQMCDGLARNRPGDSTTLLSNCLAHGRRQVIEVAPSFPLEARHILESLREVYRNDARARTEKLSPEQRLQLHQELSQPLMEQLHGWLQEQIEHKKVEPNSGLGGAIQYLLKRWEALTLFLRVPGAQIDNNLCERGLKMAILHRKNSLSYKTERGARVGDLFMSLIHTCRLNAINPFDYLLALARHAREVAQTPERWLPWTYRENIAADTS